MKLKEIEKFANEMSKLKVRCKCGCNNIFTAKTDSKICRGCGRRTYKTPEIEFKEKLKKEMKK